ncbi:MULTISPECIES: ABC transporter permease [unclassified Granulicatella]|uniref:ABC transporter permease n=1 Tax=unclassified Granulicatella TaxID=2630493 RepID=UPI001D15FC96|nr:MULTISPECIES: ABC transporter permease [unclassified Granulicatella]
MDSIVSSVSQGILWAVMAIGIFLTYRILNLPDLTAEGSFPLGAVVCTQAIVNGISPLVATCLGVIAGMLAGAVSGFLHTKMHIPALLTGIITLSGLYSVNLLILGKANVSLLKSNTLISMFQSFGLSKTMAVLVLGSLVTFFVIGVLIIFLNTELGLALRATGDNYTMGQANGIFVDRVKIFGYMLSNGLIALSGALMAQNNGFVDLNMGVGTIVIGLASIILAEVIIKHLSLGKRLISIVGGAIIYRLIIVMIFMTNIDTQLLKLVSAILLAIILYIPEIRQKLGIKKITMP